MDNDNEPSSSIESLASLKAVPKAWQSFEDEVVRYLSKMLDSGDLGIEKKLSRVTVKKDCSPKIAERTLSSTLCLKYMRRSTIPNRYLFGFGNARTIQIARLRLMKLKNFTRKKCKLVRIRPLLLPEKGSNRVPLHSRNPMVSV